MKRVTKAISETDLTMYARMWVKFLNTNGSSSYGNEGPWEIGKRRSTRRKPSLCSVGYHACNSYRDALRYAPGDVAAICDVGGRYDYSPKKTCFQRMTIIAKVNVHAALVQFAEECVQRWKTLLAQPDLSGTRAYPPEEALADVRTSASFGGPIVRIVWGIAERAADAFWTLSATHGAAEEQRQEKRLHELIATAFAAAENAPASQATIQE